MTHFEFVVEEHYQTLYRFALSLIKIETDASDLVQQTFYIFSKNQNRIKNPNKVKSWLFTTLYREFLSFKNRYHRIVYVEPGILELEVPTIPPQTQ